MICVHLKVGPATMVKQFPLVIATKYNIPMLLGEDQHFAFHLNHLSTDCEGRGHQVEGEVYKIDQRMLEHLGRTTTVNNAMVHREFPAQLSEYLDVLEAYPHLYGRRLHEIQVRMCPCCWGIPMGVRSLKE